MTAGVRANLGAIPWASGYHPQRQRLDDPFPARGGGYEPPQGPVLPDRRRGGVLRREGSETSFQLLRHRRNEPKAFLYAFDLLELNGTDLRREPIEVRKATLASILRKSRPGVRLNEHLEHPAAARVFQHACKLGWRGSSPSGWAGAIARDDRRTGSSSKSRPRRRCAVKRKRIGVV